MKKLFCLLLTAILLLPLLAGCSEPEDSLADKFEYRLIKEDGYYYVQMVAMRDYSSGPGPAPIIRYASLEKMIIDLETGNFTEEEFFTLGEHKKTKDGKIKVPNLDALLEPIAPDFLGNYWVEHESGEYSFYYENPENASSVEVIFSERQYHDKRVEEFVHYEEKLAGRDQLTVTWVSDRNATVYTWVAYGRSHQHILYTVSANETIYYVEEEYADAESGVLDALYIWFEYQGEYIYIYVNDPEERPSVEWITSFAVKPYER